MVQRYVSTDSLDGIDWAELSALYRIAPLGTKSTENLETVFAKSTPGPISQGILRPLRQ